MSDLFKNLGSWMGVLSPWMVFVVILVVVISYMFRGAISHQIKNIKIKGFFRRGGNEEIKALLNHDLFNATSIVKRECLTKKFSTNSSFDAVKTKMFHDFMTFKLDTIHDEFSTLLDKKLNDVSKDELKKILLNTINTVVNSYTEKTRNHFIEKGVPKNDADYCIALFEEWRIDTINSLVDRINSIFSSDFHYTNFEKLLGTFEVFSMAISLIPKDGVLSFEDMNGRFKNLNY